MSENEKKPCCGAVDEQSSAAPLVLRLFGTASDSIVDGPGLRYTVFVQGCTHCCPGCHNQKSQPADGGYLKTVDELLDEIRANKLVHDVTLSGGEPFEQAKVCAELARRLKAEGYGIWTYTGYLYEDLLACANLAADVERAECADPATCDDAVGELAAGAERAASASPCKAALDPAAVAALLSLTDVLVDGPFVQSKRSLGLKWRGSSNQRLIDIPASTRSGRIVKWDTFETFPEKPASW